MLFPASRPRAQDCPRPLPNPSPECCTARTAPRAPEARLAQSLPQNATEWWPGSIWLEKSEEGEASGTIWVVAKLTRVVPWASSVNLVSVFHLSQDSWLWPHDRVPWQVAALILEWMAGGQGDVPNPPCCPGPGKASLGDAGRWPATALALPSPWDKDLPLTLQKARSLGNRDGGHRLCPLATLCLPGWGGLGSKGPTAAPHQPLSPRVRTWQIQ